MAENEQLKVPQGRGTRNFMKSAPVIIVGSVMFSFISYWRIAAVVLCDMASTAYYIGGIAEQMIGPAAPWFILGVMLFSFAVGMVYIESCSLFVRGGVYRVVKEALGALPAKAAVSALLFDYILTGPISSVSAGQYLMGWLLEFVERTNPTLAIQDDETRMLIRRVGSVMIAIAVTLYFFRKNLIGIHESSGKALRIMIFTSIVVALVLVWSAATLALNGPVNKIPFQPDLNKKVEYQVVAGVDRVTKEEREVWLRDPASDLLVPRLDETGNPVPRMNALTGRQEDPLGFMPHVFPQVAESLRRPQGIWSWLGIMGLIVAFGHSILAMSGEETMAQVYREVESPKLPNFKKAAFIIFSYSLVVTGGVSFLAVLIIPDEVRMKDYADNLLGGLAMHVVGPPLARLALNALVVVAGFLILSGAVNTSLIGSNGVLNRVGDDGVLPEKLQRPHPKYGTTYRILYLIVGLQLFTIIASRGDMILLGEAYAFGVIWSFFFKALSMLVLRFRDLGPREFQVPLNLRIGGVQVPIGLGLIFVLLAASAFTNLLTKEVATISGLVFSSAFLTVFLVTERYTSRLRTDAKHEHIEQFTEQSSEVVSEATVGLKKKPYRKLVAIRSPQNLFMLQKTLEETDPETTEVVVMTAKPMPPGGEAHDSVELDRYDRRLMTAVITLAEKVGKQITPLVVPTNNPLFAVMNTAKSLNVQELVVGASNKYSAEEQLDQMSFYWINLHEGNAAPLSILVLSETLDVHFDIEGGARIPKISERKARNVAELRAAGIGVRHVLLAHDTSAHSSDLFETVLTMLDPEVSLSLAHVPDPEEDGEPSRANGGNLELDRSRARKLGRETEVFEPATDGDIGSWILRLIREREFDLLIVGEPPPQPTTPGPRRESWTEYVCDHAPCPVFVATLPAIPREVDQK